tara:strand:+ start:308 stop:703 length:396 start_codon:yes stop_codon:yes gene_type:complete
MFIPAKEIVEKYRVRPDLHGTEDAIRFGHTTDESTEQLWTRKLAESHEWITPEGMDSEEGYEHPDGHTYASPTIHQSVEKFGVRNPIELREASSGLGPVIWNGLHRLAVAMETNPDMEVPVSNEGIAYDYE